ncbi:BTB/POZ protein [Xylaria arbuscula]|nr:BTB/POZ protein [Xylaria arbuscula]
MDHVKNKLSQLLLSGEYSDLTLVCKGQEFKVHKNIVCTQSSVIDRMMKSKFMEAQANKVEVDFDPKVLKCMLDFMYTADYKDSPEPTQETQRAKIQSSANKGEPAINDILLYHANVNSIADYYDVKGLATLSAERTCELLQKNWSVKAFCNIVQKVENSTRDKSLRKQLAQMAAAHITELLEKDCFAPGKITNNMAAEVLLALKSVFIQIGSERAGHSKALQAEKDRTLAERRRSIALNANLAEIAKIMTTRECKKRMCNTKFGVMVQSVENGERRYVVRCATCGGRHFWDEMTQTAWLNTPPSRQN